MQEGITRRCECNITLGEPGKASSEALGLCNLFLGKFPCDFLWRALRCLRLRRVNKHVHMVRTWGYEGYGRSRHRLWKVYFQDTIATFTITYTGIPTSSYNFNITIASTTTSTLSTSATAIFQEIVCCQTAICLPSYSFMLLN